MRPHEMSDAAFMMYLNSDPEVVRYTGDSPFKDIQEAEVIMERLRKQFQFDRTGRFIVELKETGEPIGWCGLRWFPEVVMHDLGYRFLKNAWGKGYATETSIACLSYGKNDLKLKRVFAKAMRENLASIRVLEKLGFKETALVLPDKLEKEVSFILDF